MVSGCRSHRSLLLLPALLGTFGLAACSEDALPADHHLAGVTFPLFREYQENSREMIRDLQKPGAPRTESSDEIPWAKTLDEAFERAKREDKPVMLATFVRENGDPHCDV